MSRGLIRDLVTYGAGRAVPAASSMLFTLLCVQTLSSEQYARYTLGLLPALIAAAFVGGLAGQPVLRFGAALDKMGQRCALLGVPLAGSLGLVPFVLLWWGMQGRDSAVAAALSLLLLPAISVTDTRRSFLVSTGQPAAVLWMDLTRTVSGLGLLWAFFFWFRSPEIAPIAAMLFGTVLGLVVSRSPGHEPSGAGVRVDRAYVGYGVWAACWMGAITLFPLIERHMLQRTHGLEAAGIYGAIADPVIALMAAGTSVAVSALSPRFVSAWDAGDSAAVNKLMRTGVLATTGLAAVTWLIGAISAALAVGRLGRLLHEFSGLASLTLVVTAAWQVAVFAHKPLELMRRVDLMFGSLVLAWATFGVAAVALVVPLGGVGLLLAKSISLMTYLFFLHVAIRRLRRGAR